jgi:hypothetical protein
MTFPTFQAAATVADSLRRKLNEGSARLFDLTSRVHTFTFSPVARMTNRAACLWKNGPPLRMPVSSQKKTANQLQHGRLPDLRRQTRPCALVDIFQPEPITFMSTPTTTPQPSAGALRAAHKIGSEYRAAEELIRLRGYVNRDAWDTRNAAEHGAGAIIDRETGVGELADQLREMVGIAEFAAKNFVGKGSAYQTIWTERTQKARATLTKYAPTP